MRQSLCSILCALPLWWCVACSPGIGDECLTNLDCDAQSSQICDLTVPAGYCTVDNCLPNNCPDQAVCVEFDSQNSYCMKACAGDEDCRPEHVCRRDKGEYGEQQYGFCYVAPLP